MCSPPDSKFVYFTNLQQILGALLITPFRCLSSVPSDYTCHFLCDLVVPEASTGGFNGTMFAYYLKTRVLAYIGSRLTASQLEDILQAMVWFYTNWPYEDDLNANRQALIQVKMLRASAACDFLNYDAAVDAHAGLSLNDVFLIDPMNDAAQQCKQIC